MFLWVRATFRASRYDQIMRLGWKIFIPVTLVWLIVWAMSGCRRRSISGIRRRCHDHLRDFSKTSSSGLLKGMA